MIKFQSLDHVEKRTFRNHIIGSFFNGIFIGILSLQDIIAKKTLLATDLEIAILTMIWPVSNFFSIYWGEILAGRDKSKFLYMAGIIGRLSLIFSFLINSPEALMLFLFLAYSSNSIIMPAQNSIFQVNYRPGIMGRLYGYSLSLYSIGLILSSIFAGRILDINGFYFRYLFIFAGICGFLFPVFLAGVKQKYYLEKRIKKLFTPRIIIEPLTNSLRLLKEEKDFRTFELFFFIYGIAFMIVLPAIPRLLVTRLKLSYTFIAFLKVILAQIGMLTLSPFLGKIHDRMNPPKFTSISFFLLVFYSGFLALSSVLPLNISVWTVTLAYLFFAIAMTGVVLSWNLSSIFFAKEKDASAFQAVHVSLTALRGLMAPLLGYLVLKYFGPVTVFSIASLLFFTASVGMWYLEKRCFKCLDN